MKNKNGYTLIEISVVVFLIGVFLFMAIPKFKDITEVNIKSASRRLTGTVKYLYNEAIFKKKVFKLAFDINSGEYWVEVLEGNEFVVSPDSILRRNRLPEGVFFKDIKTERSFGKTLEGEEEYVLFMPTGRVDYAVIHLATGHQKYYTIATKPYSGGTIVYDEYVDLLESN